ncbi:MAG: endonuclease [Verrucomicrobiaceae bacterium]|nr:endonuclease [Verrucomicrobiaceae bacterium]
MQIWRLVAHHEESDKALKQMKETGRVAIGWSDLGDLSILNPQNSKDISSEIKLVKSDTSNAMMAGPSLWNLYSEVEIGDQVIVTANGRRECVFEITGNYIFDKENAILGYAHQRPAALTDIDPQILWLASDSSVADGENVRWTLAKCKGTKKSEEIVYFEGKRFSVSSTAIERDSLVRQKCLEHFCYNCSVCSINFEKEYGEIGRNYIHVHHRVDLASNQGEHVVDPKLDLIPLCPNCHVMVHTEKPAMSVEKLKSIYTARRA